MKKLLSICLILILGFGLVFAQGNSETIENPKVVWKLSHTQSPDHYMHGAAVEMAKYVSEKTGGQFEIELFHSGTLGWEQEVLEGMQMGSVAMTFAAVSPFAVFVPEYNLFSLPGVFNSRQQIMDAMNDKEILGKLRSAAEQRNLLEVGMFQYFARELYTKEPVNSLEDIKNMKIRVMSSPVLIDTFKALGANVTTTAWAEMYSALQLGVVDGLDHVATSIKTMKFNEHVKYGMEINLFRTPMLLVVSKPMYDKLPKHYQQVLDEGAALATGLCNEMADSMNEADRQYLIDNGLKYTNPDLKPFFDAIKPVKEKYISQLPKEVQDIARKLEQM
jgi:tripartite ATP-independent transporter DctP family solute receptor